MLDGVIRVLTQVLDFFYQLTGNYGVAIIIATVLIRVIVLPLTISQTRAMKKMQELQPEQQRLQKKYKSDPEKLNQEMMKLWRENKVNPASGCLPLLIQLPILWGFFRALDSLQSLKGAPFLWLSSLGQPDPLYILPILAGITTFWQSKLTTPGGSLGGAQQSMVYVMPVFIIWLSTRFPAGLALYWVVSNLVSVAQQILVPGGTPTVKGESK